MPFDPQEYEPDLSDLMDDEILRTLVEADALLSDESKWCKDDYESDGARCLIGTIAAVVNEPVATVHCREPTDPVFESLHTAGAIDSIQIWNDLPTTTFSDVKALFARAIDARARALRGA